MTQTSSSKPVISDVLWYNQVAGFSPTITPDPVSPHMTFSCAEATNSSGETTALFAGYNLGWPYTELYGGQMPAPINMVATNLFTGATFINPCYFSTASIQRPVRLYLTPGQVASGQPSNNQTFVNAWFNADLPTLLELPPEGAMYGVSLWLDDLITPIQSIEVPANSARRTPPTTATLVENSNLVSIQNSDNDPEAVAGEIRMDGPLPSARNRIYATLPTNVFTNPPTPVDGGTPVLTLMGFTQKTRSFFWYKDTNFFATAKKSNTFGFNFDPFSLVPRPDEPESVFIVSQLGTIRSEALWIPGDQAVAT